MCHHEMKKAGRPQDLVLHARRAPSSRCGEMRDGYRAFEAIASGPVPANTLEMCRTDLPKKDEST